MTKKLFVSCTMRSGNSLLVNLLSSHPDYILLNERLHFFRFYNNHYSPLTLTNKKKLIFDLYMRLKYRHNFEIDIDNLVHEIGKFKSYKEIYLFLMNYFLTMSGKKFLGEASPMNWQSIPKFNRMFKDGRSIHLIRDPRAVFSSWKKLSSIPNYAYLNCVFNWMDSAQSAKKYKTLYHKRNYMILKYEELISQPKNSTVEICNFIDLKFDKKMLNTKYWVLNNPNLVTIPRSAHEGKNILGFKKSRTINWIDKLEEWELVFIEYCLGDLMEEMGYKLFFPKIFKLPNSILNKIKKNKLINLNFDRFIKLKKGCPKYPLDPRDYKSWGAVDPSLWFTQSELGKKFILARNKEYKINKWKDTPNTYHNIKFKNTYTNNSIQVIKKILQEKKNNIFNFDFNLIYSNLNNDHKIKGIYISCPKEMNKKNFVNCIGGKIKNLLIIDGDELHKKFSTKLNHSETSEYLKFLKTLGFGIIAIQSNVFPLIISDYLGNKVIENCSKNKILVLNVVPYNKLKLKNNSNLVNLSIK